jgi:hypothetical protein
LQHPASEQRQLLATGHFYQDKEQEVTQLLRDWLQKIL